MKKILLLLPILLTLVACGVLPSSTQVAAPSDLAAIVNATLTAMAQSAPLETAGCCVTPQPTATASPTQAPTQEVSVPALSADMLRNGTYKTQDWGEVQLEDGVFYHTPPTSQESPEAYTTHMLDTILYGDINLDGVEDAVVFLTTQSGGTGHFVQMAVVLNQGGRASNAATHFLGDRVVVESGTIQDGLITLNMRVQGPNDGMCCPSQSVTWTFRLENGIMVKAS